MGVVPLARVRFPLSPTRPVTMDLDDAPQPRATQLPPTLVGEAEPIWELVRRVRMWRGLTQYQLADILVDLSSNRGLSRHEVARWERGKRVPGRYWQQWLSAALDVPTEQLLAAARHGRRVR